MADSPSRWTSTAPIPRRPSPSTISTRAASSHHTCRCWANSFAAELSWGKEALTRSLGISRLLSSLCSEASGCGEIRVDPVPHDAPKPPGYTRFVCVSDTHSRTDPIQMPYGDVLIHAGDFTELGLPSEVKKFNEWLGSLPYEYKIVIAGNHELTFDQEFMADLIKQDFYYFPSVSKLKPENYENVQSLLTNCIYLQDSEVTVRGFRIYGSPWQPWFYGWGFNLPRGQALLEKWNLIPEGVDILITHGPPLGFLDWVPKKMQRVGCVELLNTVQRRVQPRLHVFGHIHEGYGVMADGTTTYVNASVCTVNYQPVNPPIVIDLPTPRNS
ncbi:metallophosphoesterase domain-containing protein 1 isoform X1 [Arvicanthis niloticus]|uniref:metallophosphoesterase domain-containing protein 1 isoform X1 n=1 Tax=Arvicanthis niloticus TaxID=61156 RepID=UPI00402B53FE